MNYRLNRNNALLKVILLGVALAMSIVMFSKVWFENSYENFVEDVERTYRITPIYVMNGVEKDSFRNVPGGIVVYLSDCTPQVEVATRYTMLDKEINFARAGLSVEESKPIKIRDMVAVDTMLFDIFPTAITGESAKTTLSNIGSVMLSRSLATKMSDDGDPKSMIGVSIKCVTTDYGEHIVRGFFDDFPQNSELKDIDIITPIDVMGSGKDGVIGNDRYQSFVRLIEDADIAEVEKAFEQVKKERIVPQAERWGIQDTYDVSFVLNPLHEFHSSQSDIKTMTYMLTSLAIAMLISAMLNYVLIAVTALVKRAKNIATRRCFGAPKWVVYKMLIGEALFTLAISLLLAAFVIFALQDTVEQITGVPYSALFGWSSMWIVSITSLFILLVCGVMPAVLYSQIPLSAAFTRFKDSKSRWKQGLLALQFVGASFFVSVLCIIAMQYHYILNLDMGYSYDNILAVRVHQALDAKGRELLKEEVEKVTGVAMTSYCSEAPLQAASGNDVWLPEDINSRFNIRDLYSADENYAEVLGLEIVQGRNFSSASPMGREVMVSEQFVEEMEKFTSWDGNAVGHNVIFSEHSTTGTEEYTICGVFKDFMTGTAYSKDSRAQALFFQKTENRWHSNYLNVLLVKVVDKSPEIVATLNALMQELFPEKMLYAESYTEAVEAAYSDSKNIRDLVFYSGLIVLIITLIGLIGYTRDEIQRRRSEVAIRKIHGATTREIIRLFMRDIVWLLLLGLVAGSTASLFAAGALLEMVAYKISLSWWIFASCAALVTMIITAVIIATTYKAADANPVENLS